ncbi:hypothetical protein C4Q31_12685 [Leptospira borgpetersenii serovar Ceylonica]|nr:hypothetical protein C4Q31_12685 [Leptospira borgpetersenii serovar Ceylonica]
MKWMFEAVLLIRIMEFFNNSNEIKTKLRSVSRFSRIEISFQWDRILSFLSFPLTISKSRFNFGA